MNNLILQILPAKLAVSNLIHIIQGPLVWISFVVCAFGLIFQTYRFSMMLKNNTNAQPIPEKERPVLKPETKWESFWRKLAFLKLTVIGSNPLLVTVSLIFHVCIFVTPLFVLAHNILLENFFGFGLFSFSPATSHTMTGIVLACGLFFLLRRLMIRRVRAITTLFDYMLLFLVMAPFLTGFMAHEKLFDYNLIVLLHILSCEVLLILIPFSKFFHMIFFFFGRFMIVNEHSLGTPKHSWQF
jgi:nitrate reductase gamma subunit